MVKTTMTKTIMVKGRTKSIPAKPSLTKNVLVVDDEADIQDVLVRFLQKEGHSAKAVGSGAEALRVLKKQTFDLVILDMLMPGMTGDKVAEAIRNDPKLKSQKIIFLTVVTLGEQGTAKIKSLKPVAYITKPFNMSTLRDAVRKALQ